LIDYLKDIDNEYVRALDKILDKALPYGICEYVYLEVLQGSKDQKAFEKLKEYLGSLPFYELKFGKESFERAALINMKCRKNGIAIRSTIDLLIAEIAIENKLYLLHKDNDFTNIAQYHKALKLYDINNFA
jgi:predicted nucleic acid-binding protein